MNELIKEFADQAEWKYILGTRTPVEGRDYVVTQEQAQKFAELIIQKCIEIIEPCKCGCCYGEPEGILAGTIIKQIKEHFGVENE